MKTIKEVTANLTHKIEENHHNKESNQELLKGEE